MASCSLTVEELPEIQTKICSAAYQTSYVAPGGRWSVVASEVSNDAIYSSQYIYGVCIGTRNMAHNNLSPMVAAYGWKRTA